MNWTQDQIKSFAPDAASVTAGQKLAKPGSWQNIGESENALWGECKGSGKNPYQIRIDQRVFAYRCTCPSRKLPCKHVLGLLLLAVSGNVVPKAQEPGWITEWLENRDDRAQKKKEKAEAPTKPVDEKAQAKRAQQRQNRVDAGMEQLAVWLNDLVRTGIAQLERKPRDFWEEQAKRLVDAQAPALAARIQNLADIPGAFSDGTERILKELGKIALLVEAYRKLDSFSSELQSEIRQMVGWTVDQNELATVGEQISDRWGMLGQSCEQNTKIQTQRNWYYGLESKRFLLALQFAVGTQGFSEIHVPGSFGEGTAVFWPGTGKIRGRFLNRGNEAASAKLMSQLPTQTIPEFLDFVADQTAKNPWSDRVPAALGEMFIVHNDKIWGIRDTQGRFLPFPGREIGKEYWSLCTIAGGYPLNLFGEWNGYTFSPLSAWTSDRFWNLTALES